MAVTGICPWEQLLLSFVLGLGFLYTLLFAADYLMTDLWKMGFAGYTGIFTGITFLLCLVLYRWLKKKGSQILAEL